YRRQEGRPLRQAGSSAGLRRPLRRQGCIMAAFHSRLPAATAASALMLLALGGCTGPVEAPSVRSAPPGFSADTFSREGLISGATATEEGCRALPDGLWASADRGERQECIR